MDCFFSKEPCDSKKVLHVTELKDGSYVQLHMCEKCASKYMDGSIETVSKPTGLGGLLGLLSLLMSSTVASQKRAKSKCPSCGATSEDVSKTGKFGCEKCYEHYQSSIDHIIHKCQQGIKHVGKVPKRFPEEQKKRRLKEEAALDVNEQIKNLKSKMAKAVKVENYEVAGVLKLKIEELQQQIESQRLM